MKRIRGRPPLKDERMTRHQVILDWETVQIARALGGGNLSAGLRRCAKLISYPGCETTPKSL